MNESTKNTSPYFTFKFGDVAYAVEVTSVKEVLGYEQITPVPRTAEYMKGVMNIRGTVISVIDFRVLFGLPVNEPTKATSIIVTEAALEGEAPITFGFIADIVTGVGPLENEPTSNKSKTQYVRKLGRLGQDLVLILDLQEILSHIEKDLDQE
ncbi:MAG: chemotaxis protein CheW [Treponemataceae bacterium]|nr:chemotaxis protein CheW [Treponemataceae bacterium]